jgi:predicted nucleic acid-binding protein
MVGRSAAGVAIYECCDTRRDSLRNSPLTGWTASEEDVGRGAVARSPGRPISQFDATIAAITRSRGASLATRNAKDLEGSGIEVDNPWSK